MGTVAADGLHGALSGDLADRGRLLQGAKKNENHFLISIEFFPTKIYN